MPEAPAPRFRVRMYNKLIDEYVHNSCTILTFATAFRPNFLKVPREVWLADKTRNGIVSDHDPVQVCERFSTITRQEPVQMVEMGMGEGDCGDRGRINIRLGHGALKMTQRWLPPSSCAAIDQNSLVSGLLQQEAIDRQSND